MFTPSTGRIETVTATDPYSRGLSRNGAAQLDRGPGRSGTRARGLERARQARARRARGRRRLRAARPRLQRLGPDRAGRAPRHVSRLHRRRRRHEVPADRSPRRGSPTCTCCPSFDFATVNEDRAGWKDAGDLSALPPDSDQQQDAVMKLRGGDGFNWGYDPVHYGVPEGSYATDPDGPARIVEFRRMVQALAGHGLRVVMDVVYNHTHASGLQEFSVLDRIVPGYYQRLNADGAVENSTCCANTASEHRMMEKLVADDLVHWARDYKVDGFRFDLMGHHMKREPRALARRARRAHAGEGRRGRPARSSLRRGLGLRRGERQQARRERHAGEPGRHRRRHVQRPAARRRARRQPVHRPARAGLRHRPVHACRASSTAAARATARNCSTCATASASGWRATSPAYAFTDRKGNATTGRGARRHRLRRAAARGGELRRGARQRDAVGQGHARRARRRDAGAARAHAGAGALGARRSGRACRSSTPAANCCAPSPWTPTATIRATGSTASTGRCTTNHWGMGLPGADKNRDRWPLMRPLLARADLAPGPRRDSRSASGAFATSCACAAARRSSGCAPPRTCRRACDSSTPGPSQLPGVIVMTLLGRGRRHARRWDRRGSASSSSSTRTRARSPSATRASRRWHSRCTPRRRAAADPVVKQSRFDRAKGALTVPGLTTAVFVGD